MATALGHRSYIQIGKEITYGTAVAATQKLEVISMNVSPVVGVIQDPSLTSSPSRRALYDGALFYRGTFLLRMNYEGLLKLFEAVFGSGATTVVETTARDHTFKEASALPSLTIEMVEGDVPASQQQELVGAKISELTVRGTAGTGVDAMLQVELTVIAKDKVAAQTPTAALSFPAVLPVLYHQALTIDGGTADAGADVRVRSFEVKLTSPLHEDRFYLGTKNIDEPLRQDFLTATFRFTQEYKIITLFNAAKAFTTGSPQLVFRSATGIGASSFYEFELRANQAKLIEYSNPIEGYGIILANATWEAFLDPTDVSSLVARFRNLETAI